MEDQNSHNADTKEKGFSYKKLRRAFAWNVLMSLIWFVGKIPAAVIRKMMDGLIMIGYATFFKRAKRKGLRSLDIAYGRVLSEQDKQAILKKSFRHFGRVISDMVCATRDLSEATNCFEIEHRRRLDEALSRGRGVLAVTAHLGYFPHMIFRMAKEGYKVAVIMRRPRDERIGDYCLRRMKESNVQTIYSVPARQCVRESIAALRENAIVFVLLDQHFGAPGRVTVDFFGHPAETGASPVVFAQRTKAAILPVFTVREEDGRQRIIFEREIVCEDADASDAAVAQCVQEITAVIEAYVRRYPSQWMWMHGRWKAQQ